MRRTIYQRQQAAMRKFRRAVERAIHAKTFAEKEIACRWASVWADVARASLLTRRV